MRCFPLAFLLGVFCLLVEISTVDAQTVCTDKSSPRECYEAGLAQVGAALGEFHKTQADLAQFEKAEADFRAQAAAKTDAAMKALSARIDSLDLAMKGLGNGRVLAMADIENGKIVSGSDGVSFDPGLGLVSFQNPRGMPFIPVISRLTRSAYITDTDWINNILPPDKFIVKVHPLTNEGAERVGPAHDFSMVVVGFERPNP